MKEKFEKLFSLSPQGIVVARGEDILYVNENACKLYGGSPAACKATSLFPEQLLSPQEQGHSAVVNVGDGTAAAVSCPLEDGMVLIRLTPTPADRAPAAPPALLNAMRDSLFNVRISAEQIFSRLQQESDSKLAAYRGIFFRNYFSLLRAISTADTANALRAGTLPFSPKITDVTQLCRDLVQTVCHLVGSEVLRFVCNDIITAPVDGDKLEQMLLNLISNSLLHTPAGGNITLSLRRDRGNLILSLDDEGTGIGDTTLAELFTGSVAPDFTDPTKGAGMGLEVAEGLARLHGGSLVVSARVGAGTSVRESIPIRHTDSVVFSSAEVPYRANAMDHIFRELSTALDSSRFNAYFIRYRD